MGGRLNTMPGSSRTTRLRTPRLQDAGERGVSLVETLAAVMILSFVAMSIVGLFSYGMQLNATGADYSTLTNTARSMLEELLALPYDDPRLNLAWLAGEQEERIDNPPRRILWRVAIHQVNEDNALETDAAGNLVFEPFDGLPMTSSSADYLTSNLMVIEVTVESMTEFGLGQREITVQALKAR